VRRGIGGKTVAELERNLSAAEFADWGDWRALQIEQEIQARSQKPAKEIIHW
jgi:hypothetical protein